MKNCTFIKEDKTQCKAKSIHNDNYCFWHSEKVKDQRTEAIVTGGNSPKRSYGNNTEIKIIDTSDVLSLLEETINDLRRSKLSTRNANAIGYLAGIALKALEQGNLEKRLEVIEYALKIKKQNSRWNA